ncbi:glycoside hydrolase family 15 protein [Candidatus Saccharibacteria bacterium]|nr:glycoside hydrolase family 15 protein [Candidatus Saccharibacteria bacterium]
MGRPVILGNGSLTVGLNETGLVHDFYYPYVGLENLTTSRSTHHKIGIFVDGKFSWVDDGSWQTTVDFSDEALISTIIMDSASLQVSLELHDFVDYEYNAFCRQVIVHNRSSVPRTIRVFFHQVFQISRGGRADTALYVPDDEYILDYKGRCSLLIHSRTDDGVPFDQYCVGNYAIEGKEGTWKDAEDGELSGNAVEHGGVDSVIANTIAVDAGGARGLQYWIVCADSQFGAERIHTQLLEHSVVSRFDATREHWRHWLSKAEKSINHFSETEQSAVKKSLLVIKAHTDRRGGVIASCDSSIYNFGRDYYSYVWPRDGCYVMWPLIRLGYTEEPQKFFQFCRDIMHPDGYMMHKYQPDKAIGSTWHPLIHGRHMELAIQEDESAIVLFMLAEFYNESGDKEFVGSLYNTLIQPMANFLAGFIDKETGLPHASYDLWEEKFETHTYTTALTLRALEEAANFADLFEYPDDGVKWRSVAETIAQNLDAFFEPERGILRKGFLLQPDGSLQFDNVLDVSSAFGAMMFASKAFGPQRIRATYEAIEATLLDTSPSGGSPRYEHDTYFASQPAHMGNPWFVTTLWIAQYYLQVHRNADAERLLDWTLKNRLPSGVLSEQINPTDSTPLSVLPLVWSHAELINLLLDIRD